MFNYGMKVLTQVEGMPWTRSGRDISYKQNNIKRDHTSYSRYYYQLSFTVDLQAN
jgi:hypothetical protein